MNITESINFLLIKWKCR